MSLGMDGNIDIPARTRGFKRCAWPDYVLFLLVSCSCRCVHRATYMVIGCTQGRVQQTGHSGKSRVWGHQKVSAKLSYQNGYLIDSPAHSTPHPQICHALKNLRAPEVTYSTHFHFTSTYLWLFIYTVIFLLFSETNSPSFQGSLCLVLMLLIVFPSTLTRILPIRYLLSAYISVFPHGVIPPSLFMTVFNPKKSSFPLIPSAFLFLSLHINLIKREVYTCRLHFLPTCSFLNLL